MRCAHLRTVADAYLKSDAATSRSNTVNLVLAALTPSEDWTVLRLMHNALSSNLERLQRMALANGRGGTKFVATGLEILRTMLGAIKMSGACKDIC